MEQDGLSMSQPCPWQRAIAAGADALMIEVHPNPAKALSDGPQSLTPEQFKELVREMAVIGKSVGRWNKIPQMLNSLHSETELYLELSS